MEVKPTVIDITLDTVQASIEVSTKLSTLELVTNPIPINGSNGKSAYEIALDNGFIGTEQEWLSSLKEYGIEWSSTNW